MKKEVIFVLAFIFVMVVFSGFSSADMLNVSVLNYTSNESGHSSFLNLSLNNTAVNADINITKINITLPKSFSMGTLNGSLNLSESLTINKTNISLSNLSSATIVLNGTTGYFWFNFTNANPPGTYNLTVSVTTVNSSKIKSVNTTEIPLVVKDTIAPKISFVSPTLANASTSNKSYIIVNVTASDLNLANITISLVNITGTSQSVKKVSKTSPFFYNFSGLSNGTYKIVATANDTSNNFNTTEIRIIKLNYTVIALSPAVSCTENWTCGNWTPSVCSNGTQTRSCTDHNGCGTTVNKPPTTQSCVLPKATNLCNSGKNASWDCGNWTPSPCTQGSSQIQICVDTLNNCQPENKTRTCPTTVSLKNTGSTKNGAQSSSNRSTGIFVGIVGFIVVIVVIVAFVLMKMRKKSPSSKNDFGNLNNNGKRFSFGNPSRRYTPPRPPGPPPGQFKRY